MIITEIIIVIIIKGFGGGLLMIHATYKPWFWWQFIDDSFLIWRHGEEKLKQFIDSLNQVHESKKITAEWSKERVSFLDVQVIKEGNRIITDLFTKPTDTHQLLHHTSCHPGHTKKGIPYSQALRIRRIDFLIGGWENLRGCWLKGDIGKEKSISKLKEFVLVIVQAF